MPGSMGIGWRDAVDDRTIVGLPADCGDGFRETVAGVNIRRRAHQQLLELRGQYDFFP